MSSRLRFAVALLALALSASAGAQTAAPVSVTTETSGTTLTLTTKARTYSNVIALKNDTGNELTAFTTALTLTAPNGQPVSATLTPVGTLPATVPKDATTRWLLQATLADAGTYNGELLLKAGTAILDRISVTITREAGTSPLVVEDIGTLLFGTCDEMTFTRSVRSATGTPLIVTTPTIQATRTVKEGVTENVRKPSIAPLHQGKPTARFRAPLHPALVRFQLKGFDEPAKYDATVTFTPVGLDSVTKSVTLYVRRPWCTAFLAILAGVAVSIALRRYWTQTRPRLLIERWYHVLAARLDELRREVSGDAELLSVVEAVRDSLNSAWNDMRLAEKWSETAPLEVPKKKVALLRSWISAKKLVRDLDPATAAQVVLKLDKAQGVLTSSIATATQVDEQITALQDFPSLVRAARVITTLQEQIEPFAAAHPALKPALDEQVKPLLDSAQAALTAGDAEKAVKDAGQATSALVSVVAGAVKTEIATTITDTVQRDALTKRFDEAKDVPQLQSALRGYVEALIALLQTTAPDKAAAAQAQLDSGDLAGAWKTAKDALPQITPSKAPAVTMAFPDLSALADADRWSGAGFIPPTTEDLQSVEKRIRWGDLLANIAVALIAVILGLKMLWADALSWGSATDIMIAFLWGLGLHQFSFEGIASLQEKFRS